MNCFLAFRDMGTRLPQNAGKSLDKLMRVQPSTKGSDRRRLAQDLQQLVNFDVDGAAPARTPLLHLLDCLLISWSCKAWEPRASQQARHAGDGVFSATDYVVLMHLGLRWTNSYAFNAQPWLEAFKNVTGRSEVTDWQLQSTDPDWLYFSGQPAAGLPKLLRSDATVRPDYEALLLNGTAAHAQYYAQYVRPATMRAFKHMQVAPLTTIIRWFLGIFCHWRLLAHARKLVISHFVL